MLLLTISLGCKLAVDAVSFEHVGAHGDSVGVTPNNRVGVLLADMILSQFWSDYEVVRLDGDSDERELHQ